jgi:NAD(P) transhydrogenase
MAGGDSVLTNTIPSKTLREVVCYLTGVNQRTFYGESYRLMSQIKMPDLLERTGQVIRSEAEVIKSALIRNGVELVTGIARFLDPHRIEVAGQTFREYQADKFVIAVGSHPARPDHIPFEAERVMDSDDILDMKEVPKSMIIVGGGVIGSEYASIFSALGTRVVLVDGRHDLLEFLDSEVTDALKFHMRDTGVTLRLGHNVRSVDLDETGRPAAILVNGAKISADTLLYSIGRTGSADDLNLAALGIEPDKRGRLKVDDTFRTEMEHVFAVGDVIGQPALAATAAEQGRIAARHAFGLPVNSVPELVPIGIYTLPEISMVGKTEEQLTEEGIPYESGVARYREIARGNIIGDQFGMLKLLFNPHDRKILGVHIFGSQATELIHIGQAALALGGTIDYFVDTVFNYPTFAECYKMAGLRGLNKLAN